MKALILLLIFAIWHSKQEELEFDNIRQAAMVNLINNMDTTWKAKIAPKFLNKKPEEIKCFLGALKVPPNKRLPRKERPAKFTAPDEFDSRTQWPNCESIKEVRDQSACGSCWAFGAVEAMSDRMCIASGQKKQTRISATDLLACCGACGFGCEGGWPDVAWSYWQSNGLVTGNLYGDKKWCLPYPFPQCAHHMNSTKYPPCPKNLYPTPDCVRKCQDGYPIPQDQDLIKAKSAQSLSGEDEIKQEIMENGPVENTMVVYEDFLLYKDGVYQHVTGPYLGGHAMKTIGWGVLGGKKYWTVVNSWNEEWGDHGIIRILRGVDECGIESGISAGMPPTS